MELIYLKTMEEEAIDKSKLPTLTKRKIQQLNMLVAKDKKTPSENLKDSIARIDVEVADIIQDWIERDLPVETPEEKAAAEKQIKEEDEAAAANEKAEAEKKAADEKAEAERVAAEKAAAGGEAKKLEGENAAKELANKIIAIMNTNSLQIEGDKLEELLGRKPSETESISSLNLRKVYLTTRYQKC